MNATDLAVAILEASTATSSPNTSLASTPSRLEYNTHHRVVFFINTHVLLAQILFGCSGNVLNLVVLLSRAMRSRTNLIFAAMAFADLFFLVLHMPVVLFYSGVLMKAGWYRSGFSQFFTGTLNWSSAVSIWCMMYATIERVQVFRSPFRTSKRSASPRFFLTLFAIIVGCGALTAIHFVSPATRAKVPFARNLMLLHMIMVILVPLVVSAGLNMLLIMALKQNTMPIRLLDEGQAQQSLILARSKAERKVTLMVTVILTSFIVCNAPGAIVFVMKEGNVQFNVSSNNILMQAICNSLTVTGKVLNFLLFCLSSEHFRALLRKRLLTILGPCCCSPQQPRNTYSTATKTYSVPLNEL